MMKSINLLLLFCVIAMLAWSCSESTSPETFGDFAPPPYAKAKKFPALADSAGQLAKRIPGFGGLFINSSGQLSIYLTDPATQKTKAKAVLSNSKRIREALSTSSASTSQLTIKKGRYTFTKLLAWNQKITGQILAINGVYSNGIDQSQNKLSVGVKDKSIQEKVRKQLAQLNIPEDAVFIYKRSPACTMVFKAIAITVLNPDGSPADSVDITVENKKNGETITVCNDLTGSNCSELTVGKYQIFNDGVDLKRDNSHIDIDVQGITGDLQFKEDYTVTMGICHVSKIAGPDTVRLSSK